MRWRERAPPSRDELDASSFHFAHQAQRELSKAPLVVLKKSAPKPALTGTAIGRSVRPGKAASLVSGESFASSLSSGSTRAESEDPAITSASSATISLRLQAPPSFLVCAGKSVSSNNDDESSESAAHHHHERRVVTSNSSDAVKKAAPSQSLQRSDSELELIISELREKISLQYRLEEEKRKAAIASHKSSEVSVNGALDSSRSSGSSSEPHHPRRHLKNPVERVHGNNPQPGGPLELSMSTSGSISLKRQPSSSSVTIGNAARLAPPAVIATGISTFSSSSRTSLATSASASGTLLHHSSGSIFNERDLEAYSYSRVYDEEGMLIKSYAQEPNNNNNNNSSGPTVQRPIVYHNNVVRARRVRRPATSSESERKGFSLHLEPQQQRQSGNNGASDSDSSFSDDDDGNPFLLQGALSPVGPWMVADDRQNPESLDSNSLDSHHHSSSASRFDLSPTSARSAMEDEFAELSPRSRLLWFSEFADSVEYSSESFSSCLSSSSFAFRQSQSHPGTLRPSSAAASTKTGGSKQPVRCSSAKPSSQGRRGGGQGNSDSNGVKSKCAGAGGQIKKRPQSGGSRARRTAL